MASCRYECNGSIFPRESKVLASVCTVAYCKYCVCLMTVEYSAPDTIIRQVRVIRLSDFVGVRSVFFAYSVSSTHGNYDKKPFKSQWTLDVKHRRLLVYSNTRTLANSTNSEPWLNFSWSFSRAYRQKKQIQNSCWLLIICVLFGELVVTLGVKLLELNSF